MTDEGLALPPPAIPFAEVLQAFQLLDPDVQTQVMDQAARAMQTAEPQHNGSIIVRVKNRTKRAVYDARNSVYRFVNWLIHGAKNFLENHPMVSFAVNLSVGLITGILIGIVTYVVAVFIVAGALVLLGV